MLKLFFISALFLSSVVFAKEKAPTEGTLARSFYLEITPGESKHLKFETKEEKFHCEDRLSVESFSSVKKYPSVENGKQVPVKIITRISG